MAYLEPLMKDIERETCEQSGRRSGEGGRSEANRISALVSFRLPPSTFSLGLMYDTIIIGAGMSGLAAGIRLAYYDQRVCILERHSTIGGLNSFYRLRGRDYDVGLHALTNITPKGTKTGPLARLLRQLRFKWDDFAISPQIGSEIAFPERPPAVRQRLRNAPRAKSPARFPQQADNFDRLTREIVEYDDLSERTTPTSRPARWSSSIITEPLLVEMLFCPLMFYGSAREHDMDWGQFSIMFRSIFLEGLGRPHAGVRLILKHLVRKFRSLGGELKLRAGVKRLAVEDGRVTRVVLESGEQLEARRVLSSAGWCETMRLCDDGQPGRQLARRRPAQLLRDDRHARRAAPRSRLRSHDHVLQRPRPVRLDRSRTSCATCGAA